MNMNKKKVIGLVGGICSKKCKSNWHEGGKSTVSSILQENNCYCIDCDKLGHKVYISWKYTCLLRILHGNEPNSKGFEQIVEAFGEKVIGEDGQINRRELGAIVFSNPGNCKSNEITRSRGNEKAYRYYMASYSPTCCGRDSKVGSSS